MGVENQVQLIGNLGQTVKYSKGENGTEVARGSIGTHARYKNDKGEKVERTDWHNFVAFGKRAEILNEYTTKGSKVALSGSLRTRDYVDDKDVKRYVTEVIVDEILMLDTRK